MFYRGAQIVVCTISRSYILSECRHLVGLNQLVHQTRQKQTSRPCDDALPGAVMRGEGHRFLGRCSPGRGITRTPNPFIEIVHGLRMAHTPFPSLRTTRKPTIPQCRSLRFPAGGYFDLPHASRPRGTCRVFWQQEHAVGKVD
jgi:hypothetical protein